jgi:uncharacterized RDD family membrane protein YckC
MLKPAGFWLRLVAYLDEAMLLYLPILYILSIITSSPNLSVLFSGIITLLIFILFYILVRALYSVVFTHYLGAPIGKLLTGLTITDQSGTPLTWNKILFRQLISYRFAALAFGLGFFSILKDQKRQGWHDKTVDSNVFIKRPLYPLGILALIVLTLINFLLIKQIISNFSNGPLKPEFTTFFSEYKQFQKENAASQSAILQQTSSPSATPKTFSY